MQVVFRADASIQIGTGHVMRCLTLAGALHEKGAAITFVCREHPGHLFELIESAGYRLVRLPAPPLLSSGGNLAQADLPGVSQEEDAREVIVALEKLAGCDWLIVDNYGLDIRWESGMRPRVKKIMVIDDLANRSHDCDVLLDQNYYRDRETRYDGLAPSTCNKLLGPEFALLRKQFYEARRSLRERDGNIRRILIFMGGSDMVNATTTAIKAARSIKQKIGIDVVIGGTNPHRETIGSLCAAIPDAKVYVQVDNMAGLIAQADLGIGAGGAATWERCFLGLPTLTLVFAQNQLQTTIDLASIGATVFLGWFDKLTIDDIAIAIQAAVDSPVAMQEMSSKAMRVMEGASDRSPVAEMLFQK
jgi:UDP-2,4-diacetamido-2,4,6-trideoxy-beta-L-altropyranose hydrolase